MYRPATITLPRIDTPAGLLSLFTQKMTVIGEQSTMTELALKHLPNIKDSDPGIVIEYNRIGLAQHDPNGDADAASEVIKNTIVDAGMNAAEDGESCSLFTGRALAATAALDAVFGLHWARHQNGIEDVGKLYYVFPKGANNVEFCPIHHIFGA
jgi:hypothetical protein